MDFNLSGSKVWGPKNEFSDVLHDQLFNVSKSKSKKWECETSQKIAKTGKRLCFSSQSCNIEIQNKTSSEVECNKYGFNNSKKKKSCNLRDIDTNNSCESNLCGFSPECIKEKKEAEKHSEKIESLRIKPKKVNKRNKYKSKNIIVSDALISAYDRSDKKMNILEYTKDKKKGFKKTYFLKKESVDSSLHKQAEEFGDVSKTDQCKYGNLISSKINSVVEKNILLDACSPEIITKNVKKKKLIKKGKNKITLIGNSARNRSIVKKSKCNALKINPSKLKKLLREHEALTQKINEECIALAKNSSPPSKSDLLKEKAMKCFQAAKFRLLNEKLYTVSGKEAFNYFSNDVDTFKDYHHGYSAQVAKWPINPVDVIIQELKKSSELQVIADLGCGDAKIARTFSDRKVHSFDLVALNEYVTCCNISKVPLANESVDVAIFCLSLMGINLSDYVREVQRILKNGGLIKIAEVESRVENISTFIHDIEKYGFSLDKKDTKHKMFIFLDFIKVKKNVTSGDLPIIKLNPCAYKKR